MTVYCELCSKQFATQSNMFRHIRSQHPEEGIPILTSKLKTRSKRSAEEKTQAKHLAASTYYKKHKEAEQRKRAEHYYHSIAHSVLITKKAALHTSEALPPEPKKPRSPKNNMFTIIWELIPEQLKHPHFITRNDIQKFYRATLIHIHPDKYPLEQRSDITVKFQEYQALFEQYQNDVYSIKQQLRRHIYFEKQLDEYRAVKLDFDNKVEEYQQAQMVTQEEITLYVHESMKKW
ncbi:hypothetical protein K7432_014767, partial [Basidiobolus ranarum]